jgi:hypothetical protein
MDNPPKRQLVSVTPVTNVNLSLTTSWSVYRPYISPNMAASRYAPTASHSIETRIAI